MTEGIGRALASAIKDEARHEADRAAGHIFRNQHRRDIFSRLTLRPCLGAAELAEAVGIAGNTAGWHLDALVRAGYLVRLRARRRVLYYPEGLITAERATFFVSINQPQNARLLLEVIQRPGLSQSEIAGAVGEGRHSASRVLAELVAAGVITKVQDGPHTRHYPSRLLHEQAESFYKQSKDWTDFVVKRMSAEGGAPPVLVKRGLDRVVIELGGASDRFTITVGVNPYLTCATR